MTTVDEIKQVIIQLPPDAFSELRQWYEALDAQAWDDQLQTDINGGLLDDLADEAIGSFERGELKSGLN